MNLLEIIVTLHGSNVQERQQLLETWGVDSCLWPHIQGLFTDRGRLDGDSIKAIQTLVWEKVRI